MGIFDNKRTLQNVLNAGNIASNRDIILDSGKLHYVSATGELIVTGGFDIGAITTVGDMDIEGDIKIRDTGTHALTGYGFDNDQLSWEGLRFGLPYASGSPVRDHNLNFLTGYASLNARNAANTLHGRFRIAAEDDKFELSGLDEIAVSDATKMTVPAGFTFDGVDLSAHEIDASAHHAKYTDGEADARIAVHSAVAAAHHARYTDGEADARIGIHAAVAGAHHAEFTTGTTYTQQIWIPAQAFSHTGSSGAATDAMDCGGIIGRRLTGTTCRYLESAMFLGYCKATSATLRVWYVYDTTGTDYAYMTYYLGAHGYGDAQAWNVASGSSMSANWTGSGSLRYFTISLSDSDLSGTRNWLSMAFGFSSLAANNYHYFVGVSIEISSDHTV